MADITKIPNHIIQQLNANKHMIPASGMKVAITDDNGVPVSLGIVRWHPGKNRWHYDEHFDKNHPDLHDAVRTLFQDQRPDAVVHSKDYNPNQIANKKRKQLKEAVQLFKEKKK